MTKRGSLTIELSLLTPAIISVLIIVIFSGYFYHDRCVIQRAAYTSVLKSSAISDADENTADMIFEDELSGRLIGKWDLQKKIETSDDYISLRVSGNMKCIDGIFTKYLSNMMYKIDISESAFDVNAPDYLRRHSLN